MGSEKGRILRTKDLKRELPHEKLWSTPATEEIKKRAMEDAERSFEKFRERLERFAGRGSSEG